MSNAVETLMNEHRLIEGVLSSLETFVSEIEAGKEGSRSTIRAYASFFSNFADKCHHGKEEDRLFTRMIEHGFPKEYGPIAVMLAEHVEGREHVGILGKIGDGDGPLSPDERRLTAAHARAYIPLLRAHIQKEDGVLYPMALKALPAAVLEKLEEEFESFEREVMGPGAHEKFHALAGDLIAAYPPDAERPAGGTHCAGCAGQV